MPAYDAPPETLPLPGITGWRALREAARDTGRFTSARPGRVPIPAEDGIRPFRQLPIETDPPETALWRALVQPWFRRPTEDGPKAAIERIVRDALAEALAAPRVDLVADVALPVQSRALAVLLDCDPALAETWIGWGVHGLRTDGVLDPAKSARFLRFVDDALERGRTDPGMGLFHALHSARIEGRPLSADDRRGVVHLALAGGRDTVIHALSGALAYLAGAPADLARLHAEPALAPRAAEEMFRYLSPLPGIGRTCPSGARVAGTDVPPEGRIALRFAEANRDPDAFEDPDAVVLDRARNPHLAFGIGPHACLGAPMARLLLRTLLSEVVLRPMEVK